MINGSFETSSFLSFAHSLADRTAFALAESQGVIVRTHTSEYGKSYSLPESNSLPESSSLPAYQQRKGTHVKNCVSLVPQFADTWTAALQAESSILRASGTEFHPTQCLKQFPDQILYD